VFAALGDDTAARPDAKLCDGQRYSISQLLAAPADTNRRSPASPRIWRARESCNNIRAGREAGLNSIPNDRRDEGVSRLRLPQWDRALSSSSRLSKNEGVDHGAGCPPTGYIPATYFPQGRSHSRMAPQITAAESSYAPFSLEVQHAFLRFDGGIDSRK